jgi:hypothetical protein
MDKKLTVQKHLSASRVKTLETCSWVYWCKYHLNLPDKSNDGALRGTICHLIFELLVNKRHKAHFTSMMAGGSIKSSPAIDRLIIKHLKKSEIYTDANYQMIDEMILVGLKNDFFGGKGGKLGKPEQEFDLENESPKYKIKGFIDKPILYDKKKEVKIVDYKSSKYKFRGDDLESNLQAMMYSLASKKIWPGYKPTVEFLFLRHPKQPLQQLEFTDEQIRGFESYLEHVNVIVNGFSEKDANTNFAVFNKKSKWMCGIGSWVCPFKKPFAYYALIEGEKIVKTSFIDDLKTTSEKQRIEKKTYSGCPQFAQSAGSSSTDAFSDLN